MRFHVPKSWLLLSSLLVFGLGTGKAKINGGASESDPSDAPAADTVAVNTLSTSPTVNRENAAPVSSLLTGDLVEFPGLSGPIKRLLSSGLELTRENLSYKYGSDDPSEGGMDCSGTIHYLLDQAGIKDVPRDASEIYAWIWKANRFQAVVSSSPDTFELSRLRPGDLLFWTGTYHIDRDPPVTHVMIYLGTSRLTGRRVMVGASDGRTFNDKPRFGVSVFDFKLPRPPRGGRSGDAETSSSRFIGYSPIPGLETAGPFPDASESNHFSH